MKKSLLLISFLILFLCGQATLYAAQNNRPGRFGLGLILGSPTGISAKYWLDKTHALDAALGFGDMSIHADYLWHRWDMLPQPQSGKLATYWGLGAEVKDKRKDTEFGVRAVGGIAYNFPRHPVDVFLEVVPVLELSPNAGIGVGAGLGVRYYFK